MKSTAENTMLDRAATLEEVRAAILLQSGLESDSRTLFDCKCKFISESEKSSQISFLEMEFQTAQDPDPDSPVN